MSVACAIGLPAWAKKTQLTAPFWKLDIIHYFLVVSYPGRNVGTHMSILAGVEVLKNMYEAFTVD